MTMARLLNAFGIAQKKNGSTSQHPCPRAPVHPEHFKVTWPRDMDLTSNEVHLFSLDESGILWDYLLGGRAAVGIVGDILGGLVICMG